jgi:CheY-like chemotaxis protein/anti-sigma regulatory factor (Ser/Thr protein kinase)
MAANRPLEPAHPVRTVGWRHELEELTSMRPFLVVDDDDIALDLIGCLLQSEGWRAETASDGVAAWERLDADPDRYDLVILDRFMPRMDGIAVLESLRADARFEDLPVIMQTSAVDPEQVREGLLAGAWYYLAKPYHEASLRHLVRVALHDRAARLELRGLRQEREFIWEMLQEARFAFRSPEEAERLAALLAVPTPDPAKVSLGLLELLLNAVEHGNLELGYDGKSAVIEAECWREELTRRMADPRYGKRIAEVWVRRDGERLVYRIKDQGPGFDWQDYLEIDPARLFDSHGRGIAMARHMAFSRLDYRGNGNEVEAVVELASAPGGAPGTNP